MFKAALSIFLFSLPSLVLAEGLVPCGGRGEEACQTCHIVPLVSSVFAWIVGVAGVIAVILVILSGLKMVMSGGNVSAKESARRTMANMVIGYVLVLAGWMLVDLFLKTFVDDTTFGVWNSIGNTCVTQPLAVGRLTASGSNASTMNPSAVNSQVSSIQSSGSLQTDIANAAAAAGITDPEQVNILRALIAQESSNCSNLVGPPTAYGTAYGCGQIIVSTARTLDSGLASLSDAQVAERLRTDNQYNLTLSARYYNQLLTRYNGDESLALAAYNGGPGANGPSTDCPGTQRWRCEWDSPGCYNTSNRSCRVNTGYIETRNYVSNIRSVAQNL